MAIPMDKSACNQSVCVVKVVVAMAAIKSCGGHDYFSYGSLTVGFLVIFCFRSSQAHRLLLSLNFFSFIFCVVKITSTKPLEIEVNHTKHVFFRIPMAALF